MADRSLIRVRTMPDGVTLVQWRDRKGALVRGYVPTAVADDPSAADLKAAAPYGDLTSRSLPRVTIAPTRALDILHKRGIWTTAQLRRSPHLLRDAYAAVVRQALQAWEEQQRIKTREEQDG